MPTLSGVGAFSGRYPWWVSVLALSISSLLCLGLRSVYVQTDPQKLWVAPSFVAAREQANFNELFGPFFRVEQLIFYVDGDAPPPQKRPHSSWVYSEPERICDVDGSHSKAVDDLIDRKYLLKLADVELAIRRASVQVENKTYSLEDFCYRPIKGKGCLVTSPFQYWLANRTLLEGDPDIKLTTACQTTDPTLKDRSPCMDQNGVPVMRNVVFGGLASDSCHENPDPCGESTPKAKSLVATFLLHNNPSDETYTTAVKAWESQVFISIAEQAAGRLLNDTTADGMRLTYMAERSVADSLEVQTSQNAFIVVVSYLVMFLYVSLSLGKLTHPIHSRFGLGLTGILIVLFSLGISMGVCSAIFQLEVTMITLEVVPFLILAIGVDNMFILTNEFDRIAALRGLSASSAQTPRRRTDEDELLSKIMGETMANVGPSITVAAISECLAFLVGALTRIPALTTFCIVAAVAVLADYLLQLTWFAAALALDTRRVRARRYDLFPWARQAISLNPDKALSSRRGSQSASGRIDDSGGIIKSFIVKTYAPFITRRTTKLVVLLSSLAFVLLSILGAQHIPLGLEQELAVPTDFYLHEYFRVQTKYGEAGPPAYLVLGDGIDYTNGTVQMEVNQLIDDFSSIRQYIQLPIFSWLQTFNQWRQMRYFLHEKIEDGSCDCPEQPLDPFPYEVLKALPHLDHDGGGNDANVTPNALFYPLVKNFSLIEIDSQCCQNFGLCGAQYANDLVFKTDAHSHQPNGLRGSRMRFQAAALKNQSMFVNSYYYMHAVTRKWEQNFKSKHGRGSVFPYTLFFVYEEQYTYIQGIALQSVLLALLVVFISVFILMHRNLRLSVIVIVCVLSMTLSLLGYLFLWNAVAPIATSMNAVSVVNLLATVGLGVEFCVHMTHQFAFSRVNRLGITGDDHTKHALASVGASIISGITLTKFCGIGVLAFAPSMLFRVYFFRMYLGIVLLGFFHVMVLLPVLLSLFGQPASYPNDFSTFLLSEEQEEMDNDVDGNAYTEY